MSAVYHFELQSIGDEIVSKTYASAFGDLDVINYIAKKVVKEIEGVDGNFALTLDEVDAIGGANTVRTVVDLTANGRVVATVLKGELTSERKAARTADSEDVLPEVDEIPAEKYGENVPAVTY